MWSSERRGREAPYKEDAKNPSNPSGVSRCRSGCRPSATTPVNGFGRRTASVISRKRESEASDLESNKENASNNRASTAVSGASKLGCTGTGKSTRPVKLQRRLSSNPSAASSSATSHSAPNRKGEDSGGDAAGRRIHRELRGLILAVPLKSRRTSAYLPEWSLSQKLDLLLKMGVVATTEVNESEEVHTLSICGQFAEENHLAMLKDSDRVSYYRKVRGFPARCGLCTPTAGDQAHILGCTVYDILHPRYRFVQAMQWTGEPSSRGRKLVEGRRVLEIGTGPISLLSINAVNAGAEHVVALEASRPSHCRAKKFVEAIGMNHKIDVVQGYSKRIPIEVFKNPEIVIHEIIGDFASQEGELSCQPNSNSNMNEYAIRVPLGAQLNSPPVWCQFGLRRCRCHSRRTGSHWNDTVKHSLWSRDSHMPGQFAGARALSLSRPFV